MSVPFPFAVALFDVRMWLVQWFYKARTRFNRDSCLRYAIRLVGIPAPYGLFVNDHFPMDYQAAIVESSDAHVQ